MQLTTESETKNYIQYERLFAEYGELLTLEEVANILRYPTSAAFRKAISRGQCPFRIISVEKRRGRFVKTSDLVEYLQSL